MSKEQNDKGQQNLSDPDRLLVEYVQGQLSAVEEGKVLVDFMRGQQVDLAFEWDSSGASWSEDGKTLSFSRDMNRALVLGAMAREYRRAWIGAHNGIETPSSHIDDIVFAARVVEGDVMSYQLSLMTALLHQGVLGDVAKGFSSVATADAAAQELMEYASAFIVKHKENPFSEQARLETFAFLQRSRFFHDELDIVTASKALSSPSVTAPHRPTNILRLCDVFEKAAVSTCRSATQAYLPHGLYETSYLKKAIIDQANKNIVSAPVREKSKPRKPA